MKKLFSVLVLAGMVALVACGPSAEEIAAKEKAKADSIAAAQKAIDDSIAAAEIAKADSIAAAAQKVADSLAAVAKNTKGTKAPKQTTYPGQTTKNAPKGKG